MGYEITKFNFQDDLASALFNAKFQEIETYLNNIKEELKNVKEKNTEIEKENQKLKEQLDNKVDKVTVYSLNQLSVQDLQNGGFEHNYETTTNKASEIGLGSGIWHIKYLKYVSAEGYGFQIALPVTGDVPKWRKAWGNEFKAWQNL